MRILMPSIVDPREARGGAWTVTGGLIRVLELAWPGLTIECIPVPSRSRIERRARQLRCLAQGAAGIGLPAKVAFSSSSRLRRSMIAALRATPPDLIILNGSDLLWLFPFIPQDLKVLVIAHNIEHELYRAQLSDLGKRSRLVASLLERDWARLQEYEWSGLRSAHRVVFLSTEDRDTALEECPSLDSIVLPPVFDYVPNARRNHARDRLVIGMFADFSWWPNQSSLKWFLDEVWPHLEADVELHLAGYGSDVVMRGPRPRVQAHGFVNDPREVFSKCDLMIAPMITGAGVKVKVAEALFNRVPMIVTSVARRGLPLDSTAPILVCNTAAEWATALRPESARLLAARPVPDELASRFSPERYASAFRAFAADDQVASATAALEERGQLLHNLSLTSNAG